MRNKAVRSKKGSAPAAASSTIEATGAAGAALALDSHVDGLEALIGTSNTSLAAILAKIIASPATETTAAAILAKIIAAPATEAKQDTIITALATMNAHLAAIETNTTTPIPVTVAP